MTAAIRAQSATVRAIGPGESRVKLSGMMPWRLTRPSVGLRPTTPHMAAGRRIEPPESEPRLPYARRAATETAEPLDEPPEIRAGSQGLQARPTSRLRPKGLSPLSEVFKPPRSTAPAASRRASVVAVWSGT